MDLSKPLDLVMVELMATCKKMGFIKSDADPNLYYLRVGDEPLILVLYVDDIFLTGSSRLIKDCKENLAAEFDMKDLGLMHYFLGLEVWQQKCEIFLGQGRYATKILKRFKMEEFRPMATPMITNWKKIDTSEEDEADFALYRQLIGSLMYLVNTQGSVMLSTPSVSSSWNQGGHIGQQPSMFSDTYGERNTPEAIKSN